MEYKVKLSQTFLPYLLVLLVIVGVTVYLDRLSESYSSEAEVIVVNAPDESEQIALWQPEIEERLPQAKGELSDAIFQKGLQAYTQGDWQQARSYWQSFLENNPQSYQAWEMLGRTYIRSHRYREALDAFQQSLALNSSYIPALVNKGNAYAGLQQFHQAESSYRLAAKQSQDYPLPYLNLGIVLSQQQRWSAALSELQKATTLAEKKAKAKSTYYAGFAHLQLRDTATALRLFGEAKRLHPNYLRPQIQEILLSNASVAEKKSLLLDMGRENKGGAEALVRYHLASLYEQQGDYEAAEKSLQKALRARPTDVDLEIALGRHYLQQHQLTQAEMLFKRLLNLDSLLPQPYYYLARLAAQKSNQKEALEMYSKAIAAADDNYPEAYLGKGIAEETLNNTQAAIQSYQQALNLWPDYPQAYYHMGQAYLKNHQLEQALSAYRKSLDVRPDYANAWHGLGLAYVQAGQQDSARLSLQNALVYQPGLLNARMSLGLLHSQEGDYGAAVDQYQLVLEQHPTFLPALVNLGYAYEKAGENSAALQAFQRVIALQPENNEAKKKLAYLYASQKKVKKAEKIYEELVEAIPYDHKLRYNLALQYEQQKKFKAAIVQLQKALELEPEYERASKKLDVLLGRLGQSPNLAFEE